MSNPVGGSGSRQHSLGVLVSALGLSVKLFRINIYGQTPRFARYHPRVTLLESVLPRAACINSLESVHTENRGRGAVCPISYYPTLGPSPAMPPRFVAGLGPRVG